MMTYDLSRQEILDLSRETTLYEWTAQKAMQPMVVDRAKGIYFWDADGKRYMDFNSQLMCVNIGHGDERVIDAIKAQMDQLCYIAPTAATTAIRAETRTTAQGGHARQSDARRSSPTAARRPTRTRSRSRAW